MSNPEIVKRLAGLSLVIATLASVQPAKAQFPGAEELANAIASSMEPRWMGPRTEPPIPRPRPIADGPWATSLLSPLAVHATAGTEPELVDEALAALEATADLMRITGWDAPFPDGGRGGTVGFDLYLWHGDAAPDSAPPPPRPSSMPRLQHRSAPWIDLYEPTEGIDPGDPFDARLVAAHADGPVSFSYLDAVSTFAIVDPHVGHGAIAACVAEAYAEATLLSLDPAEARSWRRATATWLAWMITGRRGCSEAVAAQQRQPWRSYVPHDPEGGAGGAILLAAISARHDGGTGDFIRDVWDLTRQRTWEGQGLRASPDLWMAFAHVIDLSGDGLEPLIEGLAVNRFFAGAERRLRPETPSYLRGLGSDATVPLLAKLEWGRLPRRTPPMRPAVEPFGSGYVLVDVAAAPPNSMLRVWLRGEYGVRWLMTASRLDDAGHELARVSIPARRNPNGYLMVELLEHTAQVLLVVTNLSSRLPDADVSDEYVRSFSLIVDARPQG